MANPNFKENKLKRFLASIVRPVVKIVSKKLYISLQYKYITGHKLDWKNLTRYTEKLQYLRLYTYPKNKQVSSCAGRVGAREYIKQLQLDNYLIPIVGIYDSYKQINFDSLPDKFVIKATHACGFNYICLNKEQIDHRALKKQINKWLSTNYGKKTVELHYGPIKPQLIIEHYIGIKNHLPTEYKIHVFNGVAKYLYVVTNRGKDIRYNNLLIDWSPFDGAQFNHWSKSEITPQKPINFEEMVKISELIAAKFPFCRVDLYSVNNKIYFGEMTFTPAKGTLVFDDDNADYIIGKWLDIDKFISSK